MLTSFDERNDGNSPDRVWFDPSGVIYGVAQYGLHGNTGSVFRLVP